MPRDCGRFYATPPAAHKQKGRGEPPDRITRPVTPVWNDPEAVGGCLAPER